jgi:GH15 family glucan-1,4-alpha-glucosidase
MLWQKPCYDCWEENRNEMHIYTLSCIYRGLKSSDSLLASNTFANTTSQIKKWILEEGVISGSLCKFKGNGAIDSSLLGVHFPNDVFGNKEAIMRKTVDRIHSELYKAGGLHRYAEDSYYGGGIWILLTAWLGIWFFDDGNPQAAEEILDWIGIKADKDGHLAEQYADSLNNSTFLPIWNKKWGESANPLLWSHAMYIILHKKLYPGI